jgi:hypothetical protein
LRVPDGTPRYFAYGHLPLYLEWIIGHWLTSFCTQLQPLCLDINVNSFIGRLLNVARLGPYDHLLYVGRFLSALYDSGTVLCTGLLARRALRSQVAGFLSATTSAFAVIQIQNAHFGTVDTGLAFATSLALLKMIAFSQTQRTTDSLIAGICVGAAASCKISGILLLVPLWVSHSGKKLGDSYLQYLTLTNPVLFLSAVILGLLTFALCNPYALIDFGVFGRAIAIQSQVVSGSVDWTFTRQYMGSLPIAYVIEQHARWGLGLPLALSSYAGFLIMIFKGNIKRNQVHFMLVLWGVIALALAGIPLAKFPRYSLPLLPILHITNAWLLCSTHISPPHYWLKVATRWGTSILVIGTTIFSGLAFWNMYTLPHPWIEASHWMITTFPKKSHILTEYRDDALPLELDSHVGSRLDFYVTNVDIFREPDSTAKIQTLSKQLASSNYVVIASNRLYAVITHLPGRYPLSSAYYDQLFNGSLGFTFNHSFSRYPFIGAFQFGDNPIQTAGLEDPGVEWPSLAKPMSHFDESFTVYDHPLVLIFKNYEHLTAETLFARITRGHE